MSARKRTARDDVEDAEDAVKEAREAIKEAREAAMEAKNNVTKAQAAVDAIQAQVNVFIAQPELLNNPMYEELKAERALWMATLKEREAAVKEREAALKEREAALDRARVALSDTRKDILRFKGVHADAGYAILEDPALTVEECEEIEGEPRILDEAQQQLIAAIASERVFTKRMAEHFNRVLGPS
ncbi:hypothetical protein HDU96_000757, partial [Phlyctochytrium bullatum]